jgi:hemoglobin
LLATFLTLPAYCEDHAGREEATASAASSETIQPTIEEQMAALEAMCAGNAEARTERHAAQPLFERLGGEEKIHALTREIVRLHLENENIDYFFSDLDAEKVAHRVALFMIGGTGGPAVYDGPELRDSHADMGLTNADFLHAGADVIQAMKNLDYAQNEIDEVVCILVGLRDQVVLASSRDAHTAESEE